MDIKRKLKELLSRTGLSEDEIRFYLAVLKNPEKSVYHVSKLLQIPKDRAYNIFDSLEDKKLLKKNDGKILANPIKDYSEKIRSESRKLHRTADSLSELNNFLPFYGITQQQESFQVFDHEKAGEQFLDLSYMRWDQIQAYGDFENLLDVITHDIDRKFITNRLKRGKKCLPIVTNPHDYTFKEMIRKDKKENRLTKVYFDQSFNNFFVAILKDLNLTTIWQRQENGQISGAIFQNPTITQMHEKIYNHLDKISEYHKFRKISEMKSQGIAL